MRSRARAVWTTPEDRDRRNLPVVEDDPAEYPPPTDPVTRDFTALPSGSRHLGQVLKGLDESGMNMLRAIGSGLFQDVFEDFLQVVLGSPAEPVAGWHSGSPLDSSSQPLHRR